MKFKDTSKILEVISKLKDADELRANNRARINDLFNGSPPYTKSEAEDSKIQTNVNFLEAANIAHNARSQFYNAFLKGSRFFSVSLTIQGVDPVKARSWATSITKNINKVMKKSMPYIETLKAGFAQVVLHGIGPSMWENNWKWCPKSMSIGDVWLPSRTLKDMSNLSHFCIRASYTVAQLNRMISSEKVDTAWNVPAVKAAIKKALGPQYATRVDNPEVFSEDLKSNSGFYESDAVETVDCVDFYFLNDEDQWERRLLLDEESLPSHENNRLLYGKEGRAFAPELEQILHFQFGDGANVAPFRYHSIRSLGFMLYAVCHLQNRLRCRFNDSVFESMLWYFRNAAPEDVERVSMVQLNHMGVIPDGISIVTPQERHTISEDLVLAAMSQNRQNMAENSASFTQDVNDGTQKEMTATEAMNRMNSANVLVGSILLNAYTYALPQYREICRRFCIKGSKDKDVQEFQSECMRDGVPPQLLDNKLWNIDAERALGSGNKTLSLAQSEQLMAVRPLLDPDPQREVLNVYIAEMTDDPMLANRLVPLENQELSDAVHFANLAIGSLMLGFQVDMKKGLNHMDYVDTILKHLMAKVQEIQARGNMATPQEVAGFINTEQHLWQHLDIIAQDEASNEWFKQRTDILGKIMNEVKGYAQRLEEQAMEQGQGADPELAAKLESSRILAQTKAQTMEQTAAQKMRHKEVAFHMEQRRKDAKTSSEIATQFKKTQADIAAQDLTNRATVVREEANARREAKQPQPKPQG